MNQTIEKPQTIKLEIFKMDPKVESPFYASKGSAACDLRAFIPEEKTITLKAKGGRAKIPTGLKFVIPEGYEVQLRARSGLAYKHGVALTNGVGTIDSDYRGEIQALMINHGDEDFTINDGDRICQALIAPVYQAQLVEIQQMPDESDNDRGEGGFGSTGVS